MSPGVANDRNRELLRLLLGIKCICGDEKQSKMSHCRSCYYSLTPQQRRNLYRQIGFGYAEAYDDSVRTLKAQGRVRISQARTIAAV